MNAAVYRDHCEEHSGNCAMIKEHDKKIDDLYEKWNAMQKTLIATLTTSIFSLIGIVATLLIQLF